MCMFLSSRAHCSVVVVGAGVAGCSAAQTLIQNGIADVRIIEASSRSGGRVSTAYQG